MYNISCQSDQSHLRLRIEKRVLLLLTSATKALEERLDLREVCFLLRKLWHTGRVHVHGSSTWRIRALAKAYTHQKLIK